MSAEMYEPLQDFPGLVKHKLTTYFNICISSLFFPFLFSQLLRIWVQPPVPAAADLRADGLHRALWIKEKILYVFLLLKDPNVPFQLAVFIYYAVWKKQEQWMTLDHNIWNSPLTYKPESRQEAWRFISYMFVHAG